MRNIVFLFLLFFPLQSLVAQDSKDVFLLDLWDNDTITTTFGNARYSEVWGFSQGGMEYGLIGSTAGIHVLPIEGGSFGEENFIPGAFNGPTVIHRDYHDYRGYLYAVCDEGPSSLQIIDTKYLPDSLHLVYDSDALFIRAHNVFIDSSSAVLYVCGTEKSALELYSLADPLNPVLITLFDQVDYVHDIYVRKDTAYLNTGNQGLFVYNFSDPMNPVFLGSLEFYPDMGYNHSGWLSEDGKHYVLADETQGKSLKLLDMSDPSEIEVLSLFDSEQHENTLPHNVMVNDGLAFVSYYNDGLQIFDLRNPEFPQRIAWYDTSPYWDTKQSYGAWGIYTYLPSGNLLISDRQKGLYLFAYNRPPHINSQGVSGVFPNPVNDEAWVYFESKAGMQYRLELFDISGRKLIGEEISSDYWQIPVSLLPQGTYIYSIYGLNNEAEFSGKFSVKGH